MIVIGHVVLSQAALSDDDDDDDSDDEDDDDLFDTSKVRTRDRPTDRPIEGEGRLDNALARPDGWMDGCMHGWVDGATVR